MSTWSFLYQDETWTDREGTGHVIVRMDARYRANVAGWLRRRARTLAHQVSLELLVTPMPNGEMAAEAAELEYEALLDAMHRDPVAWLNGTPLLVALERGFSAEARAHRDIPHGCRECGEAQHHHGRQYHPQAGLHAWERPTADQILGRMRARRAARTEGRKTGMSYRQVVLAGAIATYGGRWTTRRVMRLYDDQGIGYCRRGTPRRDLQAMAARGVARPCGPADGRFYVRAKAGAA